MAPSPTPHDHRRLDGDAGTALVELALILPFLAVLVFGTFDVGRGFSLENRLTNMAREGAFAAQYDPCDTTAVEAAARSEDPGVGAVDVSVTRPGGGSACGASAGDEVRVTVSRSLTVMTPLVAAVTGPTIVVRGTATVVVQG